MSDENLKEKNKELESKVNQLNFCIEKEKKRINALRELLNELRTSKDSAEGVFNLEIGLDVLDKDINFAMRHNYPVTFASVDIENLKSIGGNIGFDMGNSLVNGVVAIFKDKIRSSDYLIRLGKYHLLIVFPKCDQQQAEIVANRIIQDIVDNRKQLEAPDFSAGFACTLTENVHDALELLNIANSRKNDSKYQKNSIAA